MPPSSPNTGRRVRPTRCGARDALLEGLRYLDDPQVLALADGSLTLRSRRLNLLGDLVRVQVWLGDRDAAVAAWLADARLSCHATHCCSRQNQRW